MFRGRKCISRTFSTLKNNLDIDIQSRNKLGIPQTILNVDRVSDLLKCLKSPGIDSKFYYDQFTNNIVPGVDETSYLKANFLSDICNDKEYSPIIDKKDAVRILGTMQGGYSVGVLVELLKNDELAEYASYELSNNILIFDYFYEVEKLMKHGNLHAKSLIESWADADWFTRKPAVPEKIKLTAFKVTGEINTDDLSPAQDAWSRPDIPLHARSMLKTPRDGIIPDEPYEVGPIDNISWFKQRDCPIAFVGDVVGTGSSRKSATNSILWHFGENIPYVPNKKRGGYCFGGKIAPIFFNTMEDSGALPIEMDVNKINMGDIIYVYPYAGYVTDTQGNTISSFNLQTPTILDSVRANGRINLIIGKSLTEKAQKYSKSSLYFNDIMFRKKLSTSNNKSKTGYTLAQKIVGNACNKDGVLPGEYCEPTVTSVGSQDTTGPMTRDELKDLACLGFSADLVMQSFCHTAAYPKPIDIITHNSLPEFINNRGGISLKPGDGIIHSWLNRMLLPDTVGTGGDSHTRFPIGISFPAGSGLVAFAAATGKMPLDMPESVLVKFKGTMQPGITLRDLVHSIPFVALQKGLLTIDKSNKKNIFNGRILEIEGLPDLTCEQAFELSDASAERSAAGCTIKLNKESVTEYLESNISLLNWMINQGYKDSNTIQRRINSMREWINNPILMEADKNAEYCEIIEIDMDTITEPILCAPNDPDAAVSLSQVSGEKIDEVFIGSCMTNIGHFRAAGKLLDAYHKYSLNSKLWISPPTKMDESKLREEGYYEIFEKAGVQLEMPGCSLCMGNQARVKDNSTVLSTSTRNFPNRLGKGANVFLASAELSAITAILGYIPDNETYKSFFSYIEKDKKDIFNYMNFNMLEQYK